MQQSLSLLLLLLSLCMSPACRSPVKTDDLEMAKPFQVKMLWGSAVTIGHEPWREEKPTMLHFWGTWCEPCRDEFPSLMKFAVEHPEISIAAISIDDDRISLLSFLKKVQYQLDKHPLAIFMAGDDSREILKSYSVTGYPTTIFINRKGQIVDGLMGSMDWQESLYIKDALRKLATK